MSKIFILMGFLCATLSGCSTYGFLGENPVCKKSPVLITDLSQGEENRHYLLPTGEKC